MRPTEVELVYKTKTFEQTWKVAEFLNTNKISKEDVISIYAHGSAHVLVYRELVVK